MEANVPLSADPVVTVRIDLIDSDPPIWREVEVPITTTLKQLHRVVQAAMEWEDAHLWSFSAGHEQISQSRAARLVLGDLLGPRKTRLLYTYDFGDCWEHRLTMGPPPVRLRLARPIPVIWAAQGRHRPRIAAAFRVSMRR